MACAAQAQQGVLGREGKGAGEAPVAGGEEEDAELERLHTELGALFSILFLLWESLREGRTGWGRTKRDA